MHYSEESEGKYISKQVRSPLLEKLNRVAFKVVHKKLLSILRFLFQLRVRHSLTLDSVCHRHSMRFYSEIIEAEWFRPCRQADTVKAAPAMKLHKEIMLVVLCGPQG